MFKKRQYFREIADKLLHKPEEMSDRENFDFEYALTEALGSAYIQGIADQTKKEMKENE